MPLPELRQLDLTSPVKNYMAASQFREGQQDRTAARERQNVMQGREDIQFEQGQQDRLAKIKQAKAQEGFEILKNTAEAVEMGKKIVANMVDPDATPEIFAQQRDDAVAELSRLGANYLPPETNAATTEMIWRNFTPETVRQIRTGTKPTAPKQQIVDGQLVTIGEGGASASPISGFVPKPTKSQSISIDKDGNIIITDGAMGPGSMTKAVTTEQQKKIISSIENIDRMNAIANSYADEYLTYAGAAKGAILPKLEKAGKNLSEKDKDFLTGRKKFENQVNFLFNQYRKDITGAAAAMQELERLKESFLNTELSPTQFKAAYAVYAEELNRVAKIGRKVLAEGLQPGTKEFGERVDEEYIFGEGESTPDGTDIMSQADAILGL